MVRYWFALVALCGVLVSGLALHVHYSTDTQPCDINERWDCGIVNHSRFASVHGVPVAVIGILGYAGLVGLSFAGPALLRFACTAAGFLYALSLTRIEAQVIHVWCLYCVLSQATITVLLLLAGLMLLQQRRSPKAPAARA